MDSLARFEAVRLDTIAFMLEKIPSTGQFGLAT